MTAAPPQRWLLRSQAIAAAQRWLLRSQKGTPKIFRCGTTANGQLFLRSALRPLRSALRRLRSGPERRERRERGSFSAFSPRLLRSALQLLRSAVKCHSASKRNELVGLFSTTLPLASLAMSLRYATVDIGAFKCGAHQSRDLAAPQVAVK